MKVDDIPAGRELDALVAEKVMGWMNCDLAGRGIAPNPGPVAPGWHKVRRIPEFSTDIKAAWEVVEHTDLLGAYGDDGLRVLGNCACWYVDDVRERWGDPIMYEFAAADTAPLVICRAALKAVGVTEVPDEARKSA